MEVFRQYNFATTIVFPLIQRDINDFRTSGITFAAADTQVMKDEGTFANTSNVPVHEGNGIYSLALISTELAAKRTVITVVDAATKLWEDQAIMIQTYGNVSAGIEARWNQTVPPADIIQIKGSEITGDNFAATVSAMVRSSVDDTAFTPTTTEFESDAVSFIEATADHYNSRLILFTNTGTSIVLDGQIAEITAYSLVASRGHFTVTALTDAPLDGQDFILI